MATLKNTTINDTGYVQIATGVSGGDASPVNGDVRYNTTTNKNEMYVNGAWQSIDGSISSNTGTIATGGASITTAGGFRIHTFTATGASTFTAPYTGRAEVLVVAGGGGGAPIGGGGGAGGYLYNGNFPIVAGVTYNTNVGVGGTGGLHHYSDEGTQGGPSTFAHPTSSSMVAIGGGKGGQYSSGTPVPGMAGGSGGGGPGGQGSPGTDYTSYPGQHPGGHGTLGQGHPGGFGHHGSGPGYPNAGCSSPGGATHAGGAGGGAGGKGYSRFSNGIDARGGSGITNSITGSGVIYAAGGGGGCHDTAYAYSPSLGGATDGTGQGGRPSPSGSPFQATAGGTNRGGGGGGGSHPGGPEYSGPGGPGIVVVRYRY